ncbi:MAG TPA: substrate-binding domain-containing protein [Trebonia sp.]|nr:substrate-binding domain-containing protein [Trebonia sp.]
MRKIDPMVDEAIQTLNIKDGPTRRKLLGGAGLVSATAAASALLAACSSSSSSAAGSTIGSFPKTPAWKFYFINHVTTNAFFTPTQYGMNDAAALLGLPNPVWSGSDNQVISQMTSAFDTAVAAGAAGIALAAISSTAFTSHVTNAMNKGIPVVTYNADGEYVNGQPQIGTNRLCYVGQSLYVSGQSMGAQIKTLVPGGGDIVIFIPQAGTGNTQPRFDGAKAALGSSYTVAEIATGAEQSVEPAAMKAYLLAHKSSLKGAFAVDAGDTQFLGPQLKSLGMSIPAGGFDTTGETVPNIQSGTLDFTIYQDPYLQGFMPVLYLYLYNISGGVLQPPDTDTGLSVITKSNVGPYVAQSRYQGSTTAEKYIQRPAGAINAPMASTST